MSIHRGHIHLVGRSSQNLLEFPVSIYDLRLYGIGGKRYTVFVRQQQSGFLEMPGYRFPLHERCLFQESAKCIQLLTQQIITSPVFPSDDPEDCIHSIRNRQVRTNSVDLFSQQAYICHSTPDLYPLIPDVPDR